MKYALPAICLCLFINSNAQTSAPKLELYAAPGLFTEKLSNDSLVPPEKRNHVRLGDVTSYALQVAVPFKNKRWQAKAGIGFSQRHYSLNKYSLDDFFISLFLFDSQPRNDTFSIYYIRFTNHYFQIPLSVAYQLNRPSDNFKLYAGMNFRLDFLIKNKADINFDLSYKTPTANDIVAAQKAYTSNNAKFVITAEPYLEGAFRIYKNIGAFIQLRPFSFYSTPLDKRLTTSTGELLSSTFGVSYSFNK